MKIKLSKSQWEQMGKKAGWIGKEAAQREVPPEKQSPSVKNLREAVNGINSAIAALTPINEQMAIVKDNNMISQLSEIKKELTSQINIMSVYWD